MKIFFVTRIDLEDCSNGQVIRALEIASGLADKGHDIYLWARGRNIESKWVQDQLKKYKFISIPQPFSKGPLNWLTMQTFTTLSLFKEYLRNRPQCVYLLLEAGMAFVVPILLLPYKTKVVEVNGFLEEEMKVFLRFSPTKIKAYLFIEKLTYKLADKVITVSNGVKEQISKKFNMLAEKISVVPNGVNTNLFYFRDTVECRNRINLDTDKLYIGFVGLIYKEQGLENLIEVAGDIIKRLPMARFIIVGDGECKLELEKLVKNYDLDNYFKFFGSVAREEVPFYIGACDLMVAPFLRSKVEMTELNPLKIGEYIYCGKPVIATYNQGISFIDDFQFGKLIDSDKNQLKDSIIDMLSNPEYSLPTDQGTSFLQTLSWKDKVEAISLAINDR